MQSSEERDILFFDLKTNTISRKFNNLPPKNISFLIGQLKELYDNKEAFHQYRNKTETLYIADISIEENHVKILINRSDKKVADIILSDLEKNTRRLIEKVDGEGNDYSTHIIVSFNAPLSQPNTHLFLLELSPGLGRAKIELFLNALIRKCKKKNPDQFTMNNPDGSVDSHGEQKKIKISSRIELHGHLSDEFKTELANGTIDFLELYSPVEHNPYDEYSYTTEKKKSLQLSLSDSGKVAEKLKMIKSICKKGNSDDMEYLRVKFINSEKISRTVHLHTSSAELAVDYIFIKKYKIRGFLNPLVSSYTELNQEVIDKVLELIP